MLMCRFLDVSILEIEMEMEIDGWIESQKKFRNNPQNLNIPSYYSSGRMALSLNLFSLSFHLHLHLTFSLIHLMYVDLRAYMSVAVAVAVCESESFQSSRDY